MSKPPCDNPAIESSALVERLLNDLIKTTNGFQTIKQEYMNAQQNLVLAEQALVPLKKENERVVNENNQLHREIIEVKENFEACSLKWRGKEMQNTSELDDCKYVIKQKEFKISELETQILELRESLCSPPEIGGGRGIEFTGALNANPVGALNAKPVLGEPNDQRMWAEELRKADERAAEFRNQARIYESKFRELENDLSMCRQKIDTRDKEIQRLSNLYEGGQTLPQLNVDYVSKQNKDTITKLNDQLDFVNRENHRLEGELESAKRSMSEVDGFIKDRKNMSSNLIDLEKKNSLLQAELRQMDTVIKTLK